MVASAHLPLHSDLANNSFERKRARLGMSLDFVQPANRVERLLR